MPTLRGMKYMLCIGSNLITLLYKKFYAPNEQLDVPVPILTLIFLNFITYCKMVQLRKCRKDLNSTQKKALQPVKMFIPVVTTPVQRM